MIERKPSHESTNIQSTFNLPSTPSMWWREQHRTLKFSQYILTDVPFPSPTHIAAVASFPRIWGSSIRYAFYRICGMVIVVVLKERFVRVGGGRKVDRLSVWCWRWGQSFEESGGGTGFVWRCLSRIRSKRDVDKPLSAYNMPSLATKLSLSSLTKVLNPQNNILGRHFLYLFFTRDFDDLGFVTDEVDEPVEQKIDLAFQVSSWIAHRRFPKTSHDHPVQCERLLNIQNFGIN